MTIISTVGTTIAGTAHKVRRHDKFGNVTTKEISRPNVAQQYFDVAGVDNHNMMRQGVIALEKRWITQSWHFRIISTLHGSTAFW